MNNDPVIPPWRRDFDASRDPNAAVNSLHIRYDQIIGTVPLSSGGTGASLSDPNIDRVMMWDDSAGQVKFGALTDINTYGSPAAGDYILAYDSSGNFVKVNWNLLPGAAGGIPTIGASTDNAIVRWNGAGGNAVQDSAVTIDDTGATTWALSNGDNVVIKAFGTYAGLYMHGAASTADYALLGRTGGGDNNLYINRPSGAAIRFYEGDAALQAEIAAGGGAFFYKTLNQAVSLTSGQGAAITTTQTVANSSDVSDSALGVNHSVNCVSATDELVTRSLWVQATNNITGGGHLNNQRVFNLVTNISAGAVTDNLSQVYLEQVNAGAVTTLRCIHIAVSHTGVTNHWGIYDGTVESNWHAAGSLKVGNSSLGVTPSRRLHVAEEQSTTNDTTYVQRLTYTSTGTPAIGIGVGTEYEVETSPGNNEIGATIEAVTTDVTPASEDFDLVFKTMAAGAAATEALRISSSWEYQGTPKTPPKDIVVRTEYAHSVETRLTLSGSTRRVTLQGTADLIVRDFVNIVGTPKAPISDFTVPSTNMLDVYQRLTLKARATLQGLADLILTDDVGTRSRIVLAGIG